LFVPLFLFFGYYIVCSSSIDNRIDGAIVSVVTSIWVGIPIRSNEIL